MQRAKRLKLRAKINIEYVAKLANLKLTTKEKKKFSKQLPEIIKYVEKLTQVETKNVEPLAHAVGLVNVWRDDSETIPSLEPSKVLSNSKQTHQDFFKVKAIFDAEP